MKLPMSWLREWLDLDAGAAQVAEALTMRGFYVEGIETLGHRYPGVVVARVLEVAKHPNADKLSLCRVDGGAGELRVVCGAPNVHAGMIAPLATVGATLPDGHVIKKSKIRGQESQGMLCSGRELKLSEDHEGILDLERVVEDGAALTPGRPLDEVVDPPDQVLEVEVPFNRPDGLGVLGLAREVRAALGGAWTESARARLAARWSGRADFDLELEDPEGCPRYIAQVVEDVRIAPSPPWLVRRLAAMGQRPVNNVVDATNLVLLELGQPMHAFDLERLRGPAIRVRRAAAGERLTTLDGKDRVLDPEVLVIADRGGPVALAGVMGGADSEVTGATRSILLECAWFEPRRVRRGSQRLGLATEASKRFERGLDPGIAPVAAARFVALLRDLSPGTRLGAARDRDLWKAPARTLRLRSSRASRLLGVSVTAEEAARHLRALDFDVQPGDPLVVTVPGWRPDVTLEDDLVEEVGRAHGYDRIPEAPPDSHGVYAVRGTRERVIERARRAMLARGLHEAWTTTLISREEAISTLALLAGGDSAAEPEAQLVRVANPTSREGEYLRPNLMAGLLRACARNLRQGATAVRLFEVGTGFRSRGATGLPDETPMLCAIVAGARYAHAHDATQQVVDFLDAKGLWEAWLEEMGVDTPEWRAYSSPGWKPGASAEVATSASRIGWTGSLGLEMLRAWEIEADVHVFAAHLDAVSGQPGPRTARLPGRFPSVRRDVAFFVPEAVTHQQLESVLAGAAGEWLVGVDLFDVYAGPGTPPGMKSLAYALRFEHPERTLAEEEIQAVQDRMSAAVASAVGGRLRER
jgi:phenylalanyl-tRNA synthetase beta chain